tara:strand:- start:107 stop:229 length:123 start_codon:yes stop_codon:yes gene_type:complete
VKIGIIVEVRLKKPLNRYDCIDFTHIARGNKERVAFIEGG